MARRRAHNPRFMCSIPVLATFEDSILGQGVNTNFSLFAEKMYIEPGRSYSSPRRIASKEGKSILLHWEYKYHGDTQKYRFKEQVIGYNSTGNRIFVPLAKRNRSNASLKLVDPLPTIFVGRLELSSNKMSIVINKSRFNDTQYRFFSYITMEHIYPKRQNLKFFFSNFSLPPILVEVTGKNLSHFIRKKLRLWIQKFVSF